MKMSGGGGLGLQQPLAGAGYDGMQAPGMIPRGAYDSQETRYTR